MAAVVPPHPPVGDLVLDFFHAAHEVVAAPIAGPRGAVSYGQAAPECRREAALVLLEHEDADRRGRVRVAVLLGSRRLSDDLIVVGGFVALRGLVGFLGLDLDEGGGWRRFQGWRRRFQGRRRRVR